VAKPEGDDALEEDLDLDLEEDADSGSDDSAPPDNSDSTKDKSGKRVNDLMSKWQAEQARAAKAEAELARLRAAVAPQSGDKPADGTKDGQPSEAEEFMQFARESARKNLFDSEPALAKYGLDVSSITGSTLPEMQASLKSQKKLLAAIKTQARNEALAEHGLSPEAQTGASDPPKSFSTMSEKEFAEFLAERDARSL